VYRRWGFSSSTRIERSSIDRLVGQDQLRFLRDRLSEPDSLPLATTRFVRAVHDVRGSVRLRSTQCNTWNGGFSELNGSLNAIGASLPDDR